MAVLLAALFVAAITVRRAHPDSGWTIHLLSLVFLTFMVASKKSYTNYLPMAMFPVCMTLACSWPDDVERGVRGRRGLTGVTWFGLFCTVAVIEPSLWFRWMSMSGLESVWRLKAGEPAQVRSMVFLACQVVLLGGYAGLWRRAFGLVFAPPAGSVHGGSDRMRVRPEL
jgi:hypothetical protein